ncbi:DNA cytosine methyltransferase [Rhodococcoides corynebacterioides]|uniref:DNA cytosine methyltransferase n=1 Tax=Rhodococcoides corynebacterioides TaxID=53972 RepID=UPI003F800650
MLTLTDLFCGAGGSSTGAVQVPGVTVRVASNHWKLAVDTHNENHPDADHVCADLSQIDPRYFPTTDIGWFSPECTNHSIAKGKKRADSTPDLFGEVLPDAAAERSRATMWDVVRFTEVHRYRAVLVENVVDAWNWTPFRAWLMAMDSLGYHHEVVYLNSMHAQVHGPGAPQSRDRMYIVFWQHGNRAPDLHRVARPHAVCATCGPVRAMQSWKRTDRAPWGRYRAQYVYRCPNLRCRNAVVEPSFRPASDIIDWDLPGQRIGDRQRPLADKTLARIRAGIDRYWSPLIVEAAGNTYDSADPRHPAHGRPDGYMRAWPIDDALRTVHTTSSKALVVPVEGRDGKSVADAADPMRTMTTRSETGLAFIAELRGGGSVARPVKEALATVTASGNHHGLVTTYYGNGNTTPASDALSTVTTLQRHGLVTPSGGTWRERATSTAEPIPTRTTRETDGVATNLGVDLDDVRFRMLEPREIVAAMDFPSDYVVLGNRREQVRMAGNAVTPPAARDLVACVAESLGVVA